MEMNIYYLHPCARVCAEWLHDKHTSKQCEEVASLLSTAVQFQICEAVPELQKESCLNHPWLPWAMESIDHIIWLYDYYNALIDKMKNMFHREDREWKFTQAIRKQLVRFPRNGWVDPPQIVPGDCRREKVTDGYRDFYLKCKVKVGSYRRVQVPYWVHDDVDTFMLAYSPE